jgi:hypothetical protein
VKVVENITGRCPLQHGPIKTRRHHLPGRDQVRSATSQRRAVFSVSNLEGVRVEQSADDDGCSRQEPVRDVVYLGC